MERHIAKALNGYAQSNALRLHMPGHKGAPALKMDSVYKMDITELGFSDNLACPSGIIKRAQEDIAGLLNARHSFILTGGSTLGILAMMYAASKLGSKIIVERSAHKSVFNCLKLFNLTPVFLNEGENGYTNLKVLESADNELIGALITSPNYFGECVDLQKMASALHKNGKLLFVDGAHGGHLAKLNGSKYAGLFADAWVDGAHKTLHTLTQGAILNLNNSKLIDPIREGLNIFSTSSPSYPIMASVEDGVKSLFECGEERISNFYENKQFVVNALTESGYSVLGGDDPLKLCVDLNGIANGESVNAFLQDNGIFAELVSDTHLLFMLSIDFDRQSAARLANALSRMPKQSCEKYKRVNHFPKIKTDYLTAVNGEWEWIDLQSASGRICAENAGLFPPCNPLIMAGEIFDNEVIGSLLGKSTFGVTDNKVKVLKE